MENKTEQFARVEAYARDNGLEAVGKALMLIPEAAGVKTASVRARFQSELTHSLEVCGMLIDLHLPLSWEEEDDLLSAVLLHILPENFPVEDLEGRLAELGFRSRVFEIVDTIAADRNMTDEEQQQYYQRVQENRLALLAVLADRGNIVQQLHRYSTWNAHRYIEETKVCFFPMAIYGKEHYHELLAPISVLLEKLRSLLEVAEILLRRYEVREAELIQDIQALREENATIKGILAKFRSGN